MKPYNVAKASLLALMSVEMGIAGFKGGKDPLGGRGFLRMMTGEDDIVMKSLVSDGIYAIMKSYTKPYASCRYTHPSVEASIHFHDVISADEIEQVSIITYDLAVKGHEHIVVPNSHSAKMSIPYAAAVGLLFGKAGLSEFSEDMIKNHEIHNLMKKIKIYTDTGFSNAFPQTQTAVLAITTMEGKKLTWRVDFPKGEPQNRLTKEEFGERYFHLMGYAGISRTVSGDIWDRVHTGGYVADIMAGL